MGLIGLSRRVTGLRVKEGRRLIPDLARVLLRGVCKRGEIVLFCSCVAGEHRNAVYYALTTCLSSLDSNGANFCSWRQIGRILEDLDALAGNIAFKHCSEDPSFPLLVTASVDRYLSV